LYKQFEIRCLTATPIPRVGRGAISGEDDQLFRRDKPRGERPGEIRWKRYISKIHKWSSGINNSNFIASVPSNLIVEVVSGNF